MRRSVGLNNKIEYNGLPHKVVPFEREAGYYRRKGNQHFFKNNWSKALLYYKKTIEMAPEDPFNHYKLGCLLSKMGQIEEANRVFEYILNNIDDTYWECYFLLAVNYGILEDIQQAQACLQVYLNNAPEGEMLDEAEDLLWAINEDEINEIYIPETFEDIFFNENKDRFINDLQNMSKEDYIRKYEKDRFFRYILRRILYQGSDFLKEEIINIYGYMAGNEAKEALREFVRNPWVKDRLKQMALLQLKNIAGDSKCKAYLRGEVREVDLQNHPLKAPFWDEKWQNVLICVLENMRLSNEYDDNFFEDVQAMWVDFINKTYPDIPKLKNYKTWAAGIEYSLVRFHFLGVTQKEIAQKYDVSVSSVGAKFKVINDVLRIDQKAYRNMLFYLFQKDKGN